MVTSALPWLPLRRRRTFRPRLYRRLLESVPRVAGKSNLGSSGPMSFRPTSNEASRTRSRWSRRRRSAAP